MPRQRKFLVVTDNPERRQALQDLLQNLQGALHEADTQRGAMDFLETSDVSAAFLDADYPKIFALDSCRALRKRFPATRLAVILFGSGVKGEDQVAGLDAGADDCWRYPFNAPVCQAYLRAILRRVTLLSPREAVRAHGLSLDPLRRQATLDGKTLPLRSKEFDLLYLLIKRRGETLSREVLLNTVWETEYFGTTRTVDFHVSQLRHKLKNMGRHIQTVSGIGYRLE